MVRWKLLFPFWVLALAAVLFFSQGWLLQEVEEAERKWQGVSLGVTLDEVWLAGYFEPEVRSIVRYLSLSKQRLPRNASIDQISGEVLPDSSGQAVDVEATVQQVMMAEENQSVEWIYYFWPAEVTADMLQNINREIGRYSTYVGGSTQRQQNVKQAADMICYDLILPRAVYSFNGATGPKTAANGYQLAPILIAGESSYDYGGGVCQVSSTLYNAVLAAGLQVVERHAHSKEVNYVPENMDAAVSYDYLDFKFQNTLEVPIMIKSQVYQRTLEIILLSGGEG